jgi:hypothetical protein
MNDPRDALPKCGARLLPYSGATRRPRQGKSTGFSLGFFADGAACPGAVRLL